jgi:hypothetical protein
MHVDLSHQIGAMFADRLYTPMLGNSAMFMLDFPAATLQ